MAEFHRKLKCHSCRQWVQHPEVTAGNRDSQAKVELEQFARATQGLAAPRRRVRWHN